MGGLGNWSIFELCFYFYDQLPQNFSLTTNSCVFISSDDIPNKEGKQFNICNIFILMNSEE